MPKTADHEYGFYYIVDFDDPPYDDETGEQEPPQWGPFINRRLAQEWVDSIKSNCSYSIVPLYMPGTMPSKHTPN